MNLLQTLYQFLDTIKILHICNIRDLTNQDFRYRYKPELKFSYN